MKHRARNRGSKRTGTLGICVQACVVVRCASAMCARRASSLSRHGRDGKRKAGGKRGESGDFPNYGCMTLTNFWMVKIKDKIKNSKTRSDRSKNVAIAAKNERDASAMQQAQQINTAPNTLLLSNMPNQTNASTDAAVQQQAIAAMNTRVTSNTAADDDSGGTLYDGNDVNPSDGSPGVEMEEDEGVFDEDDHDDDAFPTVHEAAAEDPPHGAAIDINQLLDDATVLANATATANARTATTRTVVDEKTAFLERITNVTTKFAIG